MIGAGRDRTQLAEAAATMEAAAVQKRFVAGSFVVRPLTDSSKCHRPIDRSWWPADQ